MKAIFVYVTCPDIDLAKQLANLLVLEKLAACANIYPDIYSIYQWQEELHEDKEVVLLLKTSEDKFDQLSAKIKELHSYECPCILALPVLKANKEYLDWMAKQL